MYKDLQNYEPKNVEYCIEEAIKEKFPTELDFSTIEGVKVKNLSDVMKIVGKEFVATFPDNEYVVRKLDDFEIMNIREEYCHLEENVVKTRYDHLQATLERIKLEKKQAEDSYNSVLMEIQKYAEEVKKGTREARLKSKETFCIALAGYYLIYTNDTESNKMILAKAYSIPDRTEIWANEEKNREAMLNLFGLEFPEAEKPTEEEQKQEETPDDDLPFGGDNGQAPASREADNDD